LIDRLNLGRKLLNIRLIPGILIILYFIHPHSLAGRSHPFSPFDTFSQVIHQADNQWNASEKGIYPIEKDKI